MKNRKVALFILCAYALSLFASVFAVQPVRAAFSDDSSTAPNVIIESVADLEIQMASSANGVINPGDTITYTVTVKNTGETTQNNLVITDLLPPGTTYVPESTTVTYTGMPVVHTYRDEFNEVSYYNSNGTKDWSTNPWSELGPENNNLANTGAMLVIGGWLRFTGHTTTSVLTRTVPKTGASSAELSFDFRVVDGVLGPEDVFKVRVDNGSGFTTVETYEGNIPLSDKHFSNISLFPSSNAQIQFVVYKFDGLERLEIDNVQILFTTPGLVQKKDNIPDAAIPNLNSGIPPALITQDDDVDLPAGGELTLQYKVTVDNPVPAGITQIVNTVEVRSNEVMEPFEATVTDLLRGVYLAARTAAVPAAVPETGGFVRYTFTVDNIGNDPVTITSLFDDRINPLPVDDGCKIGTELVAGASCSFEVEHQIPAGDAYGTHINTFTVNGSDGYGNTGSAMDSDTVWYTNVAPDIGVSNNANRDTIPETGADAIYTYEVANNTAEAVTITSLGDNLSEALAVNTDCPVGTMLAGYTSCSIEVTSAIPAGVPDSTYSNVFIATVKDNEGGSATASSSESIIYTDVMPVITVEKHAVTTTVPEVGGSVAFVYTVRNVGEELVIIDSLVDGTINPLTGNADCQIGTKLPANTSCSFEETLTIPAGEARGTHASIFTAEVKDDEDNEAAASDSATITYTDVPPDISVTTTAAVKTVYETGDTVTFTFTVTNNSPEAAEITALVANKFDEMEGETNCKTGTVLAGGANCQFQTPLAVPPGAVGSAHVNTFTATVKDNEGNTSSASESETITYTEAPKPAITVQKEVFADGIWQDANAAPGPQITYGTDPQFRFTVRNTGNVPLTDITLTDSVYSTASCAIPISLSPDDFENGSGTDEFTCSISAVWALGQHTNEATVSASYMSATVHASDLAHYLGVNRSTDLAVTMTDGVESYVPGQPLTYTITVTNHGPDAVTGATFTDAIPPQISRWSWTCVEAGGASGCTEAIGTTTGYNATLDLPVGATITYTVVAQTHPSATTMLTNTAAISAPIGTDDSNPANNIAADENNATPEADLTLTSVADADFYPNENLSYTITVSNHGPSDAANVVVRNTLPNEVTYVSANPAIASGPDPVTWDLGTLPPGTTQTIQLVVHVNDFVSASFTNTVSVSSTTADANTANNSHSAIAEPEHPTPATLLYFRAKPVGGQNVLVEWAAEAEVDHLGYRLYRTTTPVFEAANLLYSETTNAEKKYTYTDTIPTAGTYYYWLVDVCRINQVETQFGPVEVILKGKSIYLPFIRK